MSDVDQVKEERKEVADMIKSVQQVPDVDKLMKYFSFRTDVDKKNMRPFKTCAHYPFDKPPVLKMEDGFVFVMEASLLAEVLYKFSKNRHAPSIHAAQVGVNYDFFIIVNPKPEAERADDEPEYETFINSSIKSLSDEGHKDREISASYPALYLNIERPVFADIIYYDIFNQENRERVQHEWSRYYIQNYALSRGKPFWKFASPLHKTMAMKKRNKRLGKAMAITRLI
jgi:peptide deformylase